MKVIVAVFLAIGSAAALGSGPYLPSGWRPDGPSFDLPGEVQTPVDSPLKETIVFENEASGSDSLQEYGPPKVVPQVVINQGLPDVATEQAFLNIEDKGTVSPLVEESLAEVSAEEKSELILEATTEAQLAEERATEVIERIADIELQPDITTALYAAAEAIKSEDLQATISTVEEKLDQAVIEEVEAVKELEAVEGVEAVVGVEAVEGVEAAEEVKAVEGVKNIAEVLVNLENEIKSEQVQSVEAIAEVKVNQEDSGSAQVPEGFLEYGPPKGIELLRSAAVVQEPTDAVTLENNEARRRRFSPKFRAQKNKRTH